MLFNFFLWDRFKKTQMTFALGQKLKRQFGFVHNILDVSRNLSIRLYLFLLNSGSLIAGQFYISADGSIIWIAYLHTKIVLT